VAGVAQLEVDEVGHVNDVVDGPLPDRFEPLAEPGRAGADLHATDHARGKKGADLRDRIDDLDEVCTRVRALWPAGRGGAELAAGARGNLAGCAYVAEAIPTVAGDFEVEAVLVDPRLNGETQVHEDLFGDPRRDIAGVEVLIDPGQAQVHGPRG
jgi:hypothetical protein